MEVSTRKPICLAICEDCDVTHLFQSGEGRDAGAERTNLWGGLNLEKKLNMGQETMGMSWEMHGDIR